MRESHLEDNTATAADPEQSQAPKTKRTKASRTVETTPVDVPAQVEAEVSAEAAELDDATRRQQLISHAAYRRFEARGGHHGHDAEDWAEAEKEVAGILGST